MKISKETVYYHLVKKEEVDAEKLVNEVRRDIEKTLSLAHYTCNDISFIYRITPEMCVDSLNYEYDYDEYDEIFKDIKITRYEVELDVLFFVKNTIEDIYAILKKEWKELVDWTDYGFKLEED